LKYLEAAIEIFLFTPGAHKCTVTSSAITGYQTRMPVFFLLSCFCLYFSCYLSLMYFSYLLLT